MSQGKSIKIVDGRKEWLKFVLIVLLGVTAFHATVNYLYLTYDTEPPGWDQSYHLLQSQDYTRMAARLPRIGPIQILTTYRYYPPFVYLATGPVYALLGFSEDAATLVNTPFLAIAVFATYGTGKRLVNRSAGIVGAVLFTFYPAIFGLTREYMLETGLVAMVASTNYWVLATGLKTRRHSAIYGVLVSFALLTKWTAVLFTLGPLVHVILRSWKSPVASRAERDDAGGRPVAELALIKSNSPITNRVPPLNLAISCLVVLGVAGSWYLPNLQLVYRDLTFNSSGGYFTSVRKDLGAALISYPRDLVNFAMFLPMTLLLIPGTYYLVKKHRRASVFLALWTLPPYAILTVLPFKDVRFILPVLPALAIIGSSWMLPALRLRRGTPRTRAIVAASLALLLAMIGFNFAVVTLGSGPLPQKVSLGPAPYSVTLYRTDLLWAHPASQEDWHVKDIVFQLMDNWHQGRLAYVTVLANSYRFSPAVFTYYTNRYSLTLEFHVPAGEDTKFDNFMDQFSHSDFIVSKTGNRGILFEKSAEQVHLADEYIAAPGSDFLSSFRAITSYLLPDGSTAMIFARTQSGVQEAPEPPK